MTLFHSSISVIGSYVRRRSALPVLMSRDLDEFGRNSNHS